MKSIGHHYTNSDEPNDLSNVREKLLAFLQKFYEELLL